MSRYNIFFTKIKTNKDLTNISAAFFSDVTPFYFKGWNMTDGKLAQILVAAGKKRQPTTEETTEIIYGK